MSTPEIVRDNLEYLEFKPRAVEQYHGRYIDGVAVHYMRVDDESQSGDDFERSLVRDTIASYQQWLEAHPDAPALTSGMLDNPGQLAHINRVAYDMYASDTFPVLRDWHTYMKTAVALTNLYLPEAPRLPTIDTDEHALFSGTLVDDNSRAFFRYGMDAVGIRTRGRLVQHLLEKNTVDTRAPKLVSVASGAAVPLLGFAKERHERTGDAASLKLVDIDPAALGFAEKLAHHYQVRDIAPMQVSPRFIFSDALRSQSELQGADVVDMIGIFEYIRDSALPGMLDRARSLVRPGGVVLFANMLSDREQLAFNQRGVGWPGVIPRSVEQLISIATEAGFDRDDLSVYIPEDGLYAVIEARVG